MDQGRSNSRVRGSGSTPSEESSLDLEKYCCNHSYRPSFSPPSLQPHASAGQHCESTAAYFSWPCRIKDDAEERANYFANLQKGVLPETLGQLPEGQRANTLLELMTIRAFHSKILRCYSLGTAIGFRIRRGVLTDIPAILVFVSRKVHKQWLSHSSVYQLLWRDQEAYGVMWMWWNFSYFGAPEPTPKEQLYTEIVDDLRGRSMYRLWFSVERATSFIRDDLWFGIFAGINPETFVRADGAFIPFADDFDMTAVTTSVKGIGEIGNVKTIDLQSPIDSLVGKQVMKVGRSSGLTTGTVLAYALEYNDEKGICFLTDFLVVGENQQTFDLEGDSGSLIILKGGNGESLGRSE
ncbi:UNVERIFIED_CONTAM: protein NARROW LEAF 1 [Sesamum radiatum]|uniref:Protein NARROW LEAF 1 n=1 Tax=Sesamum radiatum TaxID=300843 RepID=A0AAW2KI09_SESRA